MNKESEEEVPRDQDELTISSENNIAMNQQKTRGCRKVRPQSKDYLAIIIALLETIFLPFVLTIVVVVALYLIFLLLTY